jgi:hypothetical protein
MLGDNPPDGRENEAHYPMHNELIKKNHCNNIRRIESELQEMVKADNDTKAIEWKIGEMVLTNQSQRG